MRALLADHADGAVLVEVRMVDGTELAVEELAHRPGAAAEPLMLDEKLLADSVVDGDDHVGRGRPVPVKDQRTLGFMGRANARLHDAARHGVTMSHE